MYIYGIDISSTVPRGCTRDGPRYRSFLVLDVPVGDFLDFLVSNWWDTQIPIVARPQRRFFLATLVKHAQSFEKLH